MTWGDVIWLILRWLHAVAAVAWVGSALFYAAVIHPNLKSQDSTLRHAQGDTSPPVNDSARVEKMGQAVAGEWREFLEIAAFILLVSGTLLAFNRLSQPRVDASYAIILGVKVTLAVVMAFVAFRRMTHHGNSPEASPAQLLPSAWLTASLGAMVILLAIILRLIYQQSLVP